MGPVCDTSKDARGAATGEVGSVIGNDGDEAFEERAQLPSSNDSTPPEAMLYNTCKSTPNLR